MAKSLGQDLSVVYMYVLFWTLTETLHIWTLCTLRIPYSLSPGFNTWHITFQAIPQYLFISKAITKLQPMSVGFNNVQNKIAQEMMHNAYTCFAKTLIHVCTISY